MALPQRKPATQDSQSEKAIARRQIVCLKAAARHAPQRREDAVAVAILSEFLLGCGLARATARTNSAVFYSGLAALLSLY